MKRRRVGSLFKGKLGVPLHSFINEITCFFIIFFTVHALGADISSSQESIKEVGFDYLWHYQIEKWRKSAILFSAAAKKSINKKS